MAMKLVTPPAREPLTLAQTKDHLRVTHATDDAHISVLIPAARRWAESYSRRALITQTWDFKADRFNAWGDQIVELPLPPLQSVTSINYIDDAGASQLLDAADYQVDADSAPARLAPIFGTRWPATYSQLNAVTVRIVAGYGDSPGDIPEGIASAMLMLIGHLYEHRESVVIGAAVNKMAASHEWLLDPYRVMKAVG